MMDISTPMKVIFPASPFGDVLPEMSLKDLEDANRLRFREFMLDQRMIRRGFDAIVNERVNAIIESV